MNNTKRFHVYFGLLFASACFSLYAPRTKKMLENPNAFFPVTLKESAVIDASLFEQCTLRENRIVTFFHKGSTSIIAILNLNGETIHQYTSSTKLSQVMLHPHDKYLLLLSSDKKTFTIRDFHKNKILCSANEHAYTQVDFCKTGDYFLALSLDEKSATVYNLEGKLVCNCTTHPNNLSSAFWNQNGTQVLTKSKNKEITLWNLTKQDTIPGEQSSFNSVAFSPNNT